MSHEGVVQIPGSVYFGVNGGGPVCVGHVEDGCVLGSYVSKSEHFSKQASVLSVPWRDGRSL